MTKKKLLCCALLGALGVAQSAMAQDYDDRWYVTGSLGRLQTDDDRYMGDGSPLYGLGFGRFFSPNVSIDIEADRTSFDQGNLDWDLTGLAIVGRYHFVQDGQSWWPYLAAGIGNQYHNQEFTGMTRSRKGNDMMAKLGVGLQADMGRVDLRGEVGVRFDKDDGYIYGGAPGNPGGLDEDGYMDKYAQLTLVVALGPERSAPVEVSTPAPTPEPVVQQTCADLDDDGDGINNCNDKCAGSQAGQAIGPDGCPVPLTIDLRGVNFDFDRDTLRPDAVVILDEAVAILQKYPLLRFEVAGHTDAVGSDGYNQELSQRRAQVVFDYLSSRGIDSGRMVGPSGYGEARPIAPNQNADGSDDPDGRARNRRTELNVQN